METTHEWSSRDGRHEAPWELPVDRIAGGLIAAFTVAVAYLVIPGGLYIDDFRAQAYAAGRGVWPFIVESNATHLSPGARTVDWVQSQYWPLQHGPAVVYTLVISVALGLATWRLIRQVVPQSWAALLGLAMALFGASLVPTLAWYRQTLTTMTTLVLTLVALDAALRYLREGRRPWAAAAIGAAALGLSFSERALVVPLVVLAAAGLTGESTSWRSRVRRLMVLLLPMGAVNIVFLVFYGGGDYDHAALAKPSIAGFFISTGRSIFVNVVPGLLGGPLVWRRGGFSYAFASTPLWLVLVALATLVVLLATWLRRRNVGTGRPAQVALVALSYVVPIYVLLYVGRVSRAGVESVDDLRLYPDVAVFAAISVAAILGSVTHLPRRTLTRRTAVAALTAVAIGIATSWSGFAHYWHRSESKAYVAALRADLAKNRAPVVPTPVPDSIVPGWVQPDFSSASLVQLLRPGTQTALIDSPPVAVSSTGHLEPVKMVTMATASNTRSDFCGNGLTPDQQSLDIQFSEAVPSYRESLLQFRVLVSDTTQVDVRVTDQDGTVTSVVPFSRPDLQRGPHTFAVPVPRNVRVASVQLSRSRPEAGVCVTGLSVVIPKLAP